MKPADGGKATQGQGRVEYQDSRRPNVSALSGGIHAMHSLGLRYPQSISYRQRLGTMWGHSARFFVGFLLLAEGLES